MTIHLRVLQRGTMAEHSFDRPRISLGRAPSCDVVLQQGNPLHVGTIQLQQERARFFLAPEVNAHILREGNLLVPNEDEGMWLKEGDFIALGQGAQIEVARIFAPPSAQVVVQDLMGASSNPEICAHGLRLLASTSPLESLGAQAAYALNVVAPGRIKRVVVVRAHDGVLEVTDEAYSYVPASNDEDNASFERTHHPLLGAWAPLAEMLSQALAQPSIVVQGTAQEGNSWLFMGASYDGEAQGALFWEFSGQTLPWSQEIASALSAVFDLGCVALRLDKVQRLGEDVAEENRYFLERERRHYLYKELITESEAMRHTYQVIHEMVEHEHPVLILGEAGSGKELMARALHHLGPRKSRVFTSVHCGALSPEVLDLELFGGVASVMSEAVAARKGVLELARGGCVYLEEIHMMPLNLQAKLVRVLTEGEVRRVGGVVGRRISSRVLMSTHIDLNLLLEQGMLRSDLYSLIREHVLTVPSLRERREDLMGLAKNFLRRFATRYERVVDRFDPEVEAVLMAHPWPGNVRELQTAIEAAVLNTDPTEQIVNLAAFTHAM